LKQLLLTALLHVRSQLQHALKVASRRTLWQSNQVRHVSSSCQCWLLGTDTGCCAELLQGCGHAAADLSWNVCLQQQMAHHCGIELVRVKGTGEAPYSLLLLEEAI
jgi:hypothetical protein